MIKIGLSTPPLLKFFTLVKCFKKVNQVRYPPTLKSIFTLFSVYFFWKLPLLRIKEAIWNKRKINIAGDKRIELIFSEKLNDIRSFSLKLQASLPPMESNIYLCCLQCTCIHNGNSWLDWNNTNGWLNVIYLNYCLFNSNHQQHTLVH